MADAYITAQTFGIFLCLGTLGGKRGSISIFVYLLLGAAGLPVFSGFRGGFGVLMGTTGGYLTGFLLSALIYWLITALAGNSPKTQLLAMFVGLLTCYLFGSLWYVHIYTAEDNAATVGFILIKCVLPYLLPDVAKLFLARHLSQKLARFVY